MFGVFGGKIMLLVEVIRAEVIRAVEMLLVRVLRTIRLDLAVSKRCCSQIESPFEIAERHAGLS